MVVSDTDGCPFPFAPWVLCSGLPSYIRGSLDSINAEEKWRSINLHYLLSSLACFPKHPHVYLFAPIPSATAAVIYCRSLKKRCVEGSPGPKMGSAFGPERHVWLGLRKTWHGWLSQLPTHSPQCAGCMALSLTQLYFKPDCKEEDNVC